MNQAPKLSRRWAFPPLAQLCAGTLTLMLLGLIYGWSIFKGPLQEMFPSWTESNLSTGFTLLMSFYAIGGMVSGALAKFKKPRLLLILMAAVMFIGFMGASTIDPGDASGSLIRLYLTYCLFCGLGTGIGYNICTTVIVKWFPDHSGFALGTLLMGYGLGALCMGSIVTKLNSAVGLLSTYRIMGIGVFAVFIICSIFISDPTARVSENVPSPACEENGYTPKEALRSVSFWIIMAWAIVVSAGSLIVMSNSASIIGYFKAPAILGLVVSVTNGVSRVVLGSLIDRFGFRRVSLAHGIEFLVAAGFMLVGCLTGSVLILIVGLLLTGFGFGCTPTTQAVYLRCRFGSKHFSAIFSYAAPALLLSSVLGSSLSGLLQDLAPAGAKYTSSFVLMVVYAAIGFVLSYWLRKDSVS
ncbi:MAG: MFS transporter [Oscillospiraceae bacterium]|jgi:OFA family oxalate/formate antiporter-like MFS transporter